MIRPIRFALFLSLGLVFMAHSAAAQHGRGTEGVMLTSPSVTEVRDATSVSTNPANLALLDSWDLMYVGSWLADQEHLAAQGHGLFFGFPLGPLGLGFATEFLTPSDYIENWQGLDPRVRFSFGLAFQVRRALSFGFAYRTFWAYKLGDISAWDIGLTLRPANQLSLAFTFSDLNRPRVDYEATQDGTVPAYSELAARRYNVGLTIRPFGTDALALGGELNYISDPLRRTDLTALVSTNLWRRAQFRVRFVAEGVDDGHPADYFIDGSLVLNLPSFELGASVYTQVSEDNNRTGERGYEGTVWSVRFPGDDTLASILPASMRQKQVAQISIEDKLESRDLTALVALTERMERDPALSAVMLRPYANTIPLSAALEINRRIERLRAADKKVFCYLTNVTGSEYLACAGADEIWLNPGGGIRLAGIASHAVYFKSLLDKIGVSADIVRIGEYKSAPETYTETAPTEPAKEQVNRYMDVVYETMLGRLQADREFETLDAVRTTIEDGPFTPKQALDRGLVDKILPANAIRKQLSDHFAQFVDIEKHYGKRPLRHRRYLDAPQVAVVHIEGDLVDGDSVDVPFLGLKMSGAKTLTKTLRRLKIDPYVRAVILKINSPGGSATAADIVWNEVMSLRKAKPVIASLGSVAASGAYYIASAADQIFAEPTTLTGSIGIYYGKADVSGLLGKVGIDVTTFKRGQYADMASWTRPYTPEERERLMAAIGEHYNLFKARIIEGRGRGFSPEIVEKLAGGRVWSGIDAKHNLLVDEIGGFKQALDRARQVARIPIDTEVTHFPKLGGSFLLRVIKAIKVDDKSDTGLVELWTQQALSAPMRAVIPFALSSDATAQARLPFALVEE